jgi:hypothetical protein
VNTWGGIACDYGHEDGSNIPTFICSTCRGECYDMTIDSSMTVCEDCEKEVAA